MKNGVVTDVKKRHFFCCKFSFLRLNCYPHPAISWMFPLTGGRKCFDCGWRRNQKQKCCRQKGGEGGNTCGQKGAENKEMWKNGGKVDIRDTQRLMWNFENVVVLISTGLIQSLNSRPHSSHFKLIAKLFFESNSQCGFNIYTNLSSRNCLQQRLFWTRRQLSSNSQWRRKGTSLKRWSWADLCAEFVCFLSGKEISSIFEPNLSENVKVLREFSLLGPEFQWLLDESCWEMISKVGSIFCSCL